MLKPGTILDDRYEIIDVVGTGGMSTVYRAKDERLKRFVAIKVLKSDYSNDQNFVSKFRAEAQSSAGLTHPNIVSVYDVCEDDGRYFIVMELVEGITLKEYINLNGRLGMNQAIDYSIQIASGLEAAHEHHVIHRDIKPQNIIVSKSGILKVTDFGIAKAATSTTMSTTGIGSVHYISPEQARGGYCDERSDIYSLGITMYEMVTGRVPFEGDTNVAIALMQIQNDMIPPRQLYKDIYPSFEKIILKSTQKKPERRYLTAAALIADLNRVKANPNIDIIVAPATVSKSPTQRFTEEDLQRIKNGSYVKGYNEYGQGRFDNQGNEYQPGNYQNYSGNGYQNGEYPGNGYPNGQNYQGNGYAGAGYQGGQNGGYANGQNNGYPNGQNGGYPNGQNFQGSPQGNGGRGMSSEVTPDMSRINALFNEPDEDFYDDEPEINYNTNPGGGQKQSIKRVSDDYDDGDDNVGYEYKSKKEKPKKTQSDSDDVDPKLERAVMIGGIVAAVIVAVIAFVIVGGAMGWFDFGSKKEDSKQEETTTQVASEATTEDANLVKMINIVGLSEKAAEKDLKAAGLLNYQFVQQNSVDVKEGYVISQSVADGEQISKDTQIIVTVSAGAEELTITDVRNMPEDDAYELLKNQGFKPNRSYKSDDEVEDGKAISTDPAAGTVARAGDTVTIYVSQGKKEKTVAVPDLTGYTEADASAKLENLKLVLGTVSQEFNSEIAEGCVIRQDVSPNTEVKEGTQVGIVISKGAESKTYRGTVIGNIMTTDADIAAETVTVSVYITDAEGTHVIADGVQAFGGSCDINGSVGDLKSNDGTIIFTVIDGDGADVTAFFSSSLTLSYADE